MQIFFSFLFLGGFQSIMSLNNRFSLKCDQTVPPSVLSDWPAQVALFSFLFLDNIFLGFSLQTIVIHYIQMKWLVLAANTIHHQVNNKYNTVFETEVNIEMLQKLQCKVLLMDTPFHNLITVALPLPQSFILLITNILFQKLHESPPDIFKNYQQYMMIDP